MAPNGDVHPLSSAQQQLWFIDQLHGGATIEYLLSATLRIRGALDMPALVAALTGIAERHPVLRSRFDTVDGTAVRIVERTPAVPSTVDLSGAPAELDRVRAEDLRTPIDLRTGPPWRLTLVRLADDDTVLLVAVHHIAFDGLSWSVFAHELAELYGAHTAGLPSPLPAPAAEPDRVARAEHAGLSYWTERLADLPDLALPTDRPRPRRWAADGGAVDVIIPAELAHRLQLFGRAHRASPFMVHLAAYWVLLGRCAGQDDVAVGVSLSTRNRAELARIGMFLNTVVLRGDLSGEPSFTDLVALAREHALAAYAHRDAPFDQVIAQLAPERDPGRNPVFQAGLAWYDAGRQGYRLPGLVVALIPPLWASSAFDLSLHLAQLADGSVQAQFIYPTSLFDRTTVERLAANHLRLLTELVSAPQVPVRRLELVAQPEAERLVEWGTASTEQHAHSLPELFFANAARTPDAEALVSDVDRLSYGELAARVDALAGHLAAAGVGRETPVGIACERGSDLVVAVLAVLTAGGTCVPLPPDHPATRVRDAVVNAGVRLVLTHSTVDCLPAEVRRVDLDTADWPGTAPVTHPVIDDAQLAYVVHTSGSTGRPKGVAVSHAGIRNRVLWSVRHHVERTDRVLQKTTTGFDAAMWELLTPLIAGATMVLAPPDAHRDLAGLAAAITRHRATVLQVVPSVLRVLLGEPAFAACTSLRLVCSAGEALPAAVCARLVELLDVVVDNTYGPTECSIDATAWRYRTGTPADTTVPIGTPLTNLRVFVVDAADRLVPTGVRGELCLSGTGLARGYVNQPGLTADRFTPHPYPRTPGERWYRTGDLVRWRADGALEYLGRLDDQVKVNGVRIEPAEVETALCAHPGVASAAVVAHRTPGGDAVLAAYAVPVGGTTPQELQEHLAGRLPAPMIPSAIHLVDALPLGVNGKLDRSALPDAVATTTSAQPATPTERVVAAMMAELLGIDRVGADDDFFVLGGHSLLAIRLVLRVRREFGVELTVGGLFDDRTVARLAGRIDRAASDTSIRPTPRTADLALSFAQQRMWFLDQLDPGGVEYLIPLAMLLRGPLDVPRFRHAVDQVVARHEVLRTRYPARDGQPVQVVDEPGPAAFTVTDLTGRFEAAEQALQQASSRPFQLDTEHPVRVTVIRVAPEQHLVGITLHHIAFDAWSMAIVFRDLDDAYRGSTGTPLGVQYADFAAWQRSDRSTRDITAQAAFWRTQLADLTPLELVTDRPRPARRDPSGDTLTVVVPTGVADAITALAVRHQATTFMAMLAAFTVLLSRYSGRTDIAVGTPVAGRTRQETEDLVGFFTNTLVLRTDLSGNPTFTELLGRVRQVCTDAYANQDVPFEHLVDALQPKRDLSRNPLFQVMFELAHLQGRALTLCGTDVQHRVAGTPVAKFDLTVSVQQRPDGETHCLFEYATDLFDRSTVQRLAEHYLRLLAGIGDTPTGPVGELPMLGAAEQATLLDHWSDPAGYRLAELDPVEQRELCVPDLFAARAVQHPDVIAVECSGERLTYAELAGRVDAFAGWLRSLGVGPETVVASCLERSLAAVVVLLGVLRSGAAYVPFDPRHPARRLDFMLDDAGAAVVVTAGGFTAELTERLGDRYPVLAADEPVPATAQVFDRPDPRGLAYLIYTSGSTGQPKGVLVEHRSYAQHCRVIADAYDIRPGDRVVLLSALTFDVAMDQIAATLLAGATIVVGDPVFWTPAELPDRLAEHRVTHMEITPAYYREAMRYGAERLDGLRLMNVGSDVVTVDDARRWAATGLPGQFLCNYGPTEATVTCLLHPVSGDLPGQRAGAALPIGTPVPGTRAYVVDADLRLAPAGVPGELCLGGVRLARGYHRRPALTAERFVPDPFGPPGSRLYRTGDLVRHRQDGAVEFLGRIDQQVKIRGLRIELGEIEAALLRHPDVTEAAVITRPGIGGDPQLCGYVAGPRLTDDPATTDLLREHLRGLLPDYMVPARWSVLAALPMTTSGKVQRTALPAPSAPSGRAGTELPRNPTEELVADIWTEVLGIDRIGVSDDFFGLGGHSLLVTRVLARLHTTFGVTLPLRLLFDATTVAAVAAEVQRAVEDDIASLSDAEVAALLADDQRLSER